MGLFNDNKKHVRKLKKIADKVMAYEEEYKLLSNGELKAKTQEFKDRYAKGESLDSLLPEAFATIREASARVLNMRHFYVQIIGGICLHQGRIAEMKTGEGKTLVATLPAYLNAITGKGVHIVTVNDYLAKRDAEWMGKLYTFLGLTVGNILPMQQPNVKRAQYNCDITYCTNNELGFDYLRDNLAKSKQDRVLRGLEYCIIDEIDSILIDEARTPLIISAPGQKSSAYYKQADAFVKTLKEEDYEIDLKDQLIRLTESGVTKAERYFTVSNISDIENIELTHYIQNALRANKIMHNEQNYIVKDGEIVIVDDFTGRLMQGRRYSNGLHQAIEAKEGVEIKSESQTMATVTFQNFFRMYKKLSGMTGTAKTEEIEFNKIYALDVVTIPTNVPSQRIDEQDCVYKTVRAKTKAIVEDVQTCYESGQPVLVGTVTIEKSEEISKALRAAKIPHNVLNAKNHQLEGEIIAQAGRKGAVTIATNMAGRGTDILLGGNADYLAKKIIREKYDNDLILSSFEYKDNYTDEEKQVRNDYDKEYQRFKKTTDAEHDFVVSLGGLRIIGTERHESRRIDNQLRGRSGRQGDKGSSIFYLSLEDELMRRFGGDRIKNIVDHMRIDEDIPFQFKMISRQIEKAQKRIEDANFSVRRQVLELDEVLNQQRHIIYDERNKVLDGVDIRPDIENMMLKLVEEAVGFAIDDSKSFNQWDLEKLNNSLELNCLIKGTNLFNEEIVEGMEVSDVVDFAFTETKKQYEEKAEKCIKEGIAFKEIERNILLRIIDTNWVSHIDAMDSLKQEIGLRAYGQQDPVLAYKKEGYRMFEMLTEKIQSECARMLLGMQVTINTNEDLERIKERQRQQIANLNGRGQNGVQKQDRNAPCACGSGKKFKNCCGKNV